MSLIVGARRLHKTLGVSAVQDIMATIGLAQRISGLTHEDVAFIARQMNGDLDVEMKGQL